MEKNSEGISPVIGIILMVGITIGLVVLGATIFLSFDSPENNARATILSDERPNGVRYEIITMDTADTVTANGVVVGDNEGDSAIVLPDANGRVTVKGLNSSDETILQSGEYTPTAFSTDGSITVSFDGLLSLVSTTKYDWEIIGGRFYPEDVSKYTVDSDGGTKFLRGTKSVDTGVSSNSDNVLILARDTGSGDLKASTLLYPENSDEYGDSSSTYTLGGTGTIGESSEATLIGYDGQVTNFQYDEPTAALTKADWELVEENGATITDTPPSNTAEFSTKLSLNDSSQRGSFVIRTKDPSTGSEEDRIRVYVVPSERTTTTVESDTSGFESGTLPDDWSNETLSNPSTPTVTNSRSFSGSESLKTGDECTQSDCIVAKWSPSEVTTSSRILNLTFYWNEPISSVGTAWSVKDSNGNRLLSVATNNPQFQYYNPDTGSWTEIYSSGEYDRWHKVQVKVDYDNNNYNLTMVDTEADVTKEVSNIPLDSTNNATNFTIHEYSSGSFGHSDDLDSIAYTDSVSIDYK